MGEFNHVGHPGLVDQFRAVLCAHADQLQGTSACCEVEPQWQMAGGKPCTKNHALEDATIHRATHGGL